jgi:hypothetical protein
VAAVAAKMKAGTPLTAAETKLAQAAQPAISAAIARMDAAGGVRTGPLEVEVPNDFGGGRGSCRRWAVRRLACPTACR